MCGEIVVNKPMPDPVGANYDIGRYPIVTGAANGQT
jgi:hypothetical protein